MLHGNFVSGSPPSTVLAIITSVGSLQSEAQTFSLGNMPPHIVPFVFSYAGGDLSPEIMDLTDKSG